MQYHIEVGKNTVTIRIQGEVTHSGLESLLDAPVISSYSNRIIDFSGSLLKLRYGDIRKLAEKWKQISTLSEECWALVTPFPKTRVVLRLLVAQAQSLNVAIIIASTTDEARQLIENTRMQFLPDQKNESETVTMVKAS